MEEQRQTTDNWGRLLSRVAPCTLFVLLMLSASRSAAEEYRDPCDSSKTSWSPIYDQARVRLDRHQRDGYEFYSGTAAEAVRVTQAGIRSVGTSFMLLSHNVPRSLVIDELQATVWVRSNRTGAVLIVRVTLPYERDPQTGEPLTFELHGDAYRSAHHWQQLSCQTRDDLIRDQLQLIRGRRVHNSDGRPLDTRSMFVSEVLLKLPVERGTTDLLVDELRYGPIVRAPQETTDIVQIGGESTPTRRDSPIHYESNRLLVENKPFFPRIAPYHNENISSLRETGVNVAWVEHYDDQILIDALAQRGIWSMAAPPQPATGSEGSLRSAGLMPIPATTYPILFWTLGTRIPPQDLRRIETWIDQLRDADRAFTSPRPVVADVIGEERRFSRYVSLLGTSRHILHTTTSPVQYRDYLDHRQKLALPDRFKWSWVQTEPADGNVVIRSPSRHRPVVIEAEQIWLQAWAAISVGHKAIGYWTSTPLDEQTIAAEERRLALSLLNAQIDLLEPWLATGKVVDTVPVTINAGQQEGQPRTSNEIQAAIIQSAYGKLVIPVWYERDAQFQPGQMAARNVSVLVRNVNDAHAWQVTTTGVSPLEPRRDPGGLRVELPHFDQHAFIVLTADPGLAEKLMRRMKLMQKRCAQLWVDLAQARLERVNATHRDLEATTAPRVPEAGDLLISAQTMVARAREQLQASNYAEARRLSAFTLQVLRKLQRAHWENAVAPMTSPVSSPHAICFNTLPDHWHAIAGLGTSGEGFEENQLRSGDFEDLATMTAAGWQQLRTAVADPQRKVAELHDDAAAGQFCLRLRSRASHDTQLAQHIGPDVVVVSPKIPLRGGQIVVVSGQVRVDSLAEDEIDGLMIYDNILGTVGGLRWQEPSANRSWQRFEFFREVPASRDFQLIFELHGEGEVRLDDIRVTAHSAVIQAGQASSRSAGPGSRRNLLDFAPSLPKVRLWPSRGEAEPPSDKFRATP